VINACFRITGVEIPIIEKPRSEGDPTTLIASSTKICERLGWKRKYPDLETIVQHAWAWHQKRGKTKKLAA